MGIWCSSSAGQTATRRRSKDVVKSIVVPGFCFEPCSSNVGFLTVNPRPLDHAHDSHQVVRSLKAL